MSINGKIINSSPINGADSSGTIFAEQTPIIFRQDVGLYADAQVVITFRQEVEFRDTVDETNIIIFRQNVANITISNPAIVFRQRVYA